MKLTYSICALYYACGPLASGRPRASRQLDPRCEAPLPTLQGAGSRRTGAASAGPGGEQRKTTGEDGSYSFPALRAGKYNVRVDREDSRYPGGRMSKSTDPIVLDAQLIIQADTRVLNVDDEGELRWWRILHRTAPRWCCATRNYRRCRTIPTNCSSSCRRWPDRAPVPTADRFISTGSPAATRPDKSSIREVRINSNPFSPEYERPGFGRIEILTKPGTDTLHGQAFGQYNKEALNSRNPLLTSPKRPQYRQDMFGFNLTGPIKKGKASYGLDAQRRSTQENAFIIATTLDSEFRTSGRESERAYAAEFDGHQPAARTTRSTAATRWWRAINTTGKASTNRASGDFNLPSKAFDRRNTENSLQVTETAILSPRFINETRFMFMRSNSESIGRQYRSRDQRSGRILRRRGADRKFRHIVGPAGAFE